MGGIRPDLEGGHHGHTERKNAIVTGSTSGIGEGIAEALAKEGANIMYNGFGDKGAIDALVKKTADTYKVKTDYSNADMSKADQIAQLVADTEEKFGSVDILVNNAGIQFTANVEDFPNEKWESIISINLSAAFYAIKAAVPGMKKRKWGRIINISSAHGLVASPQKSAYVAAKHGILGLTKTVALETAQFGITCNGICPGWVFTPLVDKQAKDRAAKENRSEDDIKKEMLEEKMATMKFTTVEQIGGLAVFLCSPAADNITGAPLPIDGGWVAE
ncbi:MAG: 3-hydroxybutyrate dehydrogenase [Alphaproteobacteria bacterium]